MFIIIPIQHPLSKTSIDLRRAINRLEIFLQQNEGDPYAPAVSEMINDLKTARHRIPKELWDPDINK
jgi:hypothetical protein